MISIWIIWQINAGGMSLKDINVPNLETEPFNDVRPGGGIFHIFLVKLTFKEVGSRTQAVLHHKLEKRLRRNRVRATVRWLGMPMWLMKAESVYPCCVFPQIASFILYAVRMLYSLEEFYFFNDILPFLIRGTVGGRKNKQTTSC